MMRKTTKKNRLFLSRNCQGDYVFHISTHTQRKRPTCSCMVGGIELKVCGDSIEGLGLPTLWKGHCMELTLPRRKKKSK